jgi:hypothetical protein
LLPLPKALAVLPNAIRAMNAGWSSQPGHRMKSRSGIVAALIVAICRASQLFAGSAIPLTLEWQSSYDPSVTGYALYYGVNGGPATNRMDVGLATSVVLRDLMAQTDYAFYMVAYNADRVESDPSNELLFTAKAISALRMGQFVAGRMSVSFDVAPGAACHVEYTDTLSPPNWKLLATAIADSNGLVTVIGPALPVPGTSRFYRAAVP